MRTKAPPPFSAALVGNPQILPNPTADPDAANINPDLDENCPRVEPIALIPALSSGFYVGIRAMLLFLKTIENKLTRL
jgi:hypothetical protein